MILPLLAGGCNDEIAYPDDKYGNFDALAEIIDTRYCFLKEKNIDWAEVTAEYRAMIDEETTEYELFLVCAAMLDRL